MTILAKRSDWIQTHTGVRFFVLEPTADMLRSADIAHGLSNVCRFGGQCDYHYSVAQHCLLVADLLPPELAFEGLMHDATEAYLGDMVRPLKHQIPAFMEAEAKLEKIIEAKYGLKTDPETRELIKAADNVALWLEHSALFADQTLWNKSHLGVTVPEVDPFLPAGAKWIARWDPSAIEQEFLKRFNQMWLERQG